MRQVQRKCSGPQTLNPLEYPFANRPRKMLGQRVDRFPWQEVRRTYINGRLTGPDRETLRCYDSFISESKELVLWDLWWGWWHLAGITEYTHLFHEVHFCMASGLDELKICHSLVPLDSASTSSLLVGGFLLNNGVPSDIRVVRRLCKLKKIGD